MIAKISIQNFKSLKQFDLECANLNVLTGLNGMGKSSIIQSLLLLKQSYDKGYLNKEGLTLKGDLANIGVGRDALCQYAEKEEISFEISFSEQQSKSYKWIFGYNADSDVLPFAKEDAPIPIDIDSLAIFKSNCKYLHAERWVRNQYERSDFQVVRNRNLGKHGEYTAHYLSHFGVSEEINPTMVYGETKIKTLDFQVSAWMNEISPGAKVKATKIPGVDAVRLSYEFTTELGPTNEFSPTNVGFGVTYVLPVVVILLSAKPGDILLIENPESHVHPQGQSAIAKLIALAAQSGVQIFVETHSDHIINGILVSVSEEVKNPGHGIKSQNVKMNFIGRSEKGNVSKNHPINVHESGRIQGAPVGFFDQFSKDMKAIMGF